MHQNNRVKIPLRQKTILVIFGLFLALTILETGLRLGGFIILSLQERRNLLSLRQRGEYRIICLGESTTQGQYPAYLEEILNQRNIGIKFSVIDKGVAGNSTGFILSQLEANLDKYQPDLVVTMMGINDYGAYMPYAAGLNAQIMLFFKSFRTYKLTRFLWLHIITKAIEQDNFIQQEATFKKAIEFNPQNGQAYTELGRLYARQGKHNEAEQVFKKALELNPRNELAYTELGWLYLRQGKDTEGEQAFKKALELNPRNDEAYVELGWLYIKQGKHTEAGQVCKKAIELNPQNDQAYAELGWFYISQGRHTEAEQVFKKALKLNLQNDWAYGSLAVVYGETGNYLLRREYEEKVKQIRERFYNPITCLLYTSPSPRD